MTDQKQFLRKEMPFGYCELKGGKAQITFKNRVIRTIQGKDYLKFKRVLALDDPFEIQLYLAKITGQFKHGNERPQKRS